jgi:hypothetical protein
MEDGNLCYKKGRRQKRSGLNSSTTDPFQPIKLILIILQLAIPKLKESK